LKAPDAKLLGAVEVTVTAIACQSAPNFDPPYCLI
jgi:hypothetical protein